MTWSKAENDVIDFLVKQSEATAGNVREIKEAIVGSLQGGGKPGLQDTVRELRTDVDITRDRFIVHKTADAKDHKLIKRVVLGVGLLALIGIALSFSGIVKLIELVIKWIT